MGGPGAGASFQGAFAATLCRRTSKYGTPQRPSFLFEARAGIGVLEYGGKRSATPFWIHGPRTAPRPGAQRVEKRKAARNPRHPSGVQRAATGGPVAVQRSVCLFFPYLRPSRQEEGRGAEVRRPDPQIQNRQSKIQKAAPRFPSVKSVPSVANKAGRARVQGWGCGGFFPRNSKRTRILRLARVDALNPLGTVLTRRGFILGIGDLPTPLPIPCLLYTSPSPRDRTRSRMPSSA